MPNKAYSTNDLANNIVPGIHDRSATIRPGRP